MSLTNNPVKYGDPCQECLKHSALENGICLPCLREISQGVEMRSVAGKTASKKWWEDNLRATLKQAQEEA